MESSIEKVDWIGEAIFNWTQSGIKLQPGASVELIKSIEAQLDFEFPSDFVELYRRVDGFEDFDWNKEMFSLWSLERILKEFHEEEHSDYVGFSDYLINSHSIGFFKSNEGIYKSYNQKEPISNTFRETIELINRNPDLLY